MFLSFNKFLVYKEYSTVGSILSDPGYINQEGLTIISLLLFFGAVGKSAQLGLVLFARVVHSVHYS